MAKLPFGAAMLAVLLAGLPEPGHGQGSTGTLTGDWQGTYVCPQGLTGLTLSVTEQSGADFRGYFHFYPLPGNPVAKEGCFSVRGHVDPHSNVAIDAVRWITQPTGYVMVGLSGSVDAQMQSMSGAIVAPADVGGLCKSFEIVHYPAQPKVSTLCERAMSSVDRWRPKVARAR